MKTTTLLLHYNYNDQTWDSANAILLHDMLWSSGSQ